MAAVDLSQYTRGDVRFDLDAEKVAVTLEHMAAAIRAGVVLPFRCEINSVFCKSEREAGRLTVEFHEKVDD